MSRQQAANVRRALEADVLWESRRQQIVDLYVNGDLSQAELAMVFSVTQQGIGRGLERLGIAAKSKGRAGEGNGRFIDGAQSTTYRQMIEKDKCATCGSVEMLVIHHVDNVHTNNAPENLMVLCSPCHSSHHKREYWSRRKEAAANEMQP
tara:strand:- start:1648 stop:2097 length:450 start_codon:yes stop_codon:yes gene_type:complete